ncbi:BTB/POZ and MATH domain-containing protein 1-like [Hordeum vulgare subsp. vulgare]|uniref:BTB domain-containing protein n=1 Tax=Hordeum vulgare subsp. vulgare TaxID=112509 RepID=A0A8I7BJX7_HORVV|nr:BTB/POZ and MATH domain-containing protein 1-like [Hordeum vulgare subsp. vulgare]
MENACITFTSVARSVRMLKIDGFSLTESMDHDSCVRSRWAFDGYDWEVRVYPALACSAAGGGTGPYVVLEVAFLSKPRRGSVRAAIGCRLVDPRGILKPSNEISISKVFSRPQESSSKAAVVGRRALAASAFLRGDSFTMECTIEVLKELPDTPTDPVEEVPVPSSNLGLHLAELLQSEAGADVTFLVSGESFAAHKSILAARSPVFMAQFFGDMKEKCSHRVEIEDMEAVVFKALLHFIYTDTVVEFDEKGEEVTMLAQHLLAAADRYGLDRLKVICEGKLSDGINVDTAATSLALAEQHDCPRLKAKCVRFIIRNREVLDAVLATEGYKYLAASCPSVLADLLKSSLRVG